MCDVAVYAYSGKGRLEFVEIFPCLHQFTIGFVLQDKIKRRLASRNLPRDCGDSQIGADVIHAADGSRCTDGRPMGAD